MQGVGQNPGTAFPESLSGRSIANQIKGRGAANKNDPGEPPQFLPSMPAVKLEGKISSGQQDKICRGK